SAVARGVPVLLAALCWGSWLLNRFRRAKLPDVESASLSFSLGLIFLAFAGLGLASLGLLTPSGVWFLVAISILVHVRTATSILRRSVGAVRALQCGREDGILLAMMGLVF